VTDTITEPGLYPDLDFATYLADPVPGGSLSHSGAKTLLNASPAKFAYEREHGRPGKAAFDTGHAAHSQVLGDGMEIAVIPDEILGSNGATSTKAAKEFIADARARGAVPIKSDEAAKVQAMADAIREHPIAGKLLDPSRGQVEQSAFWRDEDAGIWCRARFDYLSERDGRLLIVDYKSCASARPRDFAKAVWNFGYASQGPWYIDGATTLNLGDNPEFLLVAQETEAPYLVNVFELAELALVIGAERNARARALFAECTESGVWPGYEAEVQELDLPTYAIFQHEEDMGRSAEDMVI
jgi:hypothetical protein